MTDSKNAILVLGGTGHVGVHIVRSLLARDRPVRVLTRNVDGAKKRFEDSTGNSPEFVSGDLMQLEDVKRAMDGAEAMVVAVSALHPATIRQLHTIEHDGVVATFEAARKAGVERIVYLSAYHLDPDLIEEENLEHGRIKMGVESALAESRLDWTVIGVPFSTEIFFATLRGDKMMFPGGGPPGLPTACTKDTGEIIAQATYKTDLGGERIRVPGPVAYSFSQAAEVLSRASGRRIPFRPIPLFPIATAAWLSRPFYPYLYYLYKGMRLINRFPEYLAESVSEDHARLHELFDFETTTLEAEAVERLGSQEK